MADLTSWHYLEKTPHKDAPQSDNPSGLYCPSCRKVGVAHCSEPEWCGGMRRMQEPALTSEKSR